MSSLSSSITSDGAASLLIPPNPSLSTEKPKQSILLNGSGRIPTSYPPEDHPSEGSISKTSLNSGSQEDGNGNEGSDSPSSQPRSAYSFPSPAPQPSSSSYISGISSPTSATSSQPPSLGGRRGSTPKISFAPLPSVPPEYKLQRRNSITLGVASRRNLLTGQGGGAGAPPGHGVKHGKLYMSDADWEAYKKQFEAKSGNEPVDLGQLAKSGAKAIWGKVKRSRSSSQSSQVSATSNTATSSIASETGPPSPQAGSSRPLVHRASDPNLPQSIPGSGIGLPTSASGGSLGTVTEEEHDDESPIDTMTSRFPIPGSPPPRPRSPSTVSTASGSGSTVFSEDGSGGSDGASSSSPTHQDYTPWSHRPRKGVIVDHPPGHIHARDLYPALAEEHGADGDATPRRRASPPPPIRTNSNDLEEEDENEDEAYDDSAAAMQQDLENDGRNTPRGGRSDQAKIFAQAKAKDWEREHEHERNRRAAVLGFDEERFGHAVTLGPAHAQDREV